MIETFSLRNFRILRDVDVELRPFALLVGPNASGKSTLLEALDLLFKFLSIADTERLALLRQAEASLSKRARGHLAMQAVGTYEGKRFQVEWSEGHVSLDREGRKNARARLDQWAAAVGAPLLSVQPPLRLTLDPEALAAPSNPKDVDLVLPPDGEGLSSILAGLQLEFPDRFQSLVESLKGIVPEVRGVRIKRIALRNGAGFELRFDMRGGEDIPASAISGGTLLTLGLLTSLLSRQAPPELVLIDELEHGLHPKALGDLIRQLRRFQEQNPELQIVATSHSPYLLDHFQAEEILLTSLDEEGYAVIKPLSDHPEYERWKDLMAPGEFWSTVGESWITQQDPKKVPAAGR